MFWRIVSETCCWMKGTLFSGVVGPSSVMYGDIPLRFGAPFGLTQGEPGWVCAGAAGAAAITPSSNAMRRFEDFTVINVLRWNSNVREVYISIRGSTRCGTRRLI